MAERRRLPDTRPGRTHRIKIDDIQGDEWDLFIRTGEYEDGSLGEVFVSIGKQGSTLQAMLDGWATLVSISLQHGVPLMHIADKFIGTSFPPSGVISDGGACSSVYDCVMRYLLKTYAVPEAAALS